MFGTERPLERRWRVPQAMVGAPRRGARWSSPSRPAFQLLDRGSSARRLVEARQTGRRAAQVEE